MSLLDAATHAVGDAAVVLVNFLTTRIFGRSFKVNPEKSKKIIENFLLVFFALFFIGLAIMGVGT